MVHSNEEALKQAFMNAMILTLHADIEPEFQVYSQSSDLCGKVIDLVKISTRRRIVVEFDNIKMDKILLDGAKGCWEEILGLKIDDQNQKGQKTVAETLKYIKKEYLGNQNDADLKSVFCCFKVGLHRLISRRIYCNNE